MEESDKEIKKSTYGYKMRKDMSVMEVKINRAQLL